MPAVGAYGQVGAHFKRSIGSLASGSNDAATSFQQVYHFVLHLHLEAGKPAPFLGEVIQKAALGHECDELAMRGQMREIGDLGGNIAETNAQAAVFLVAAPKKPFQQAEFVHDFECGWVNSVAAEI